MVLAQPISVKRLCMFVFLHLCTVVRSVSPGQLSDGPQDSTHGADTSPNLCEKPHPAGSVS